jgi:hypothetical protein
MQGPDLGYDSYGQPQHQDGDQAHNQQYQYHHSRPYQYDDGACYHDAAALVAASAAGPNCNGGASCSSMHIPTASTRAQRLGVYRLGRTVGMGAFSKVKVRSILADEQNGCEHSQNCGEG